VNAQTEHFIPLKTGLAKRPLGTCIVSLGAFFALSFSLSHASSARADDAADRTSGKSHRGDYKTIVEKDAEEAMEDYRRDKKRRARQKAEDLDRRREEAERKAERDSDDKDNYDLGLDTLTAKKGSQFDASTYQDTDFSRRSFIDLMIQSRPDSRDKPLSADDDDARSDDLFKKSAHPDDTAFGDKGDDRDDDKYGAASDKDRDGKDKKDGDRKRHFDEMSQVYQDPVPPGPNNWVPDKLDPLDNGGFELSPYNGSPVPYRLNGHVDLERGRPWKDSDN